MQNKLFIFLSVSLFTLVSGSPVLAQYSTSNTNCLNVDTKVRSVTQADFYDNLSSKQYLFTQGSVIEFSDEIINNCNTDLTDIVVVDKVNPCLDLVFYPGTLSSNKDVMSWNIANLASGSSKKYTLRATVSDRCIPKSSIVKHNNFLEASTSKLYDDDRAYYYVGGPTLPDTGNELMVLGITLALGAVALATTGRKLIRGY